jgi:hypothetical protein
MEVDSHGKTAVMVAAVRAYHSADPEPRVFDDPLANVLLTRAEHETFESIAAEGLRRLNPALAETCSEASSFVYHAMRAGAGAAIALTRARYVEDALRGALDRGVRQYVILGAGLDTFALDGRISQVVCAYSKSITRPLRHSNVNGSAVPPSPSQQTFTLLQRISNRRVCLQLSPEHPLILRLRRVSRGLV